MKASFRKEFSLRVVGLSLVAALALGAATMSQAQAQSGSAQAAPAKAKATAPVAQTVAKKPATKGQSEGIRVHGHWVIEVKNPDGSLAKRVEFENSLVTSTNYPGASLTGSQALVGVLSGVAALSASQAAALGFSSPWVVDLESVNSGNVSPCPGSTAFLKYALIGGLPGSSSTASCGSFAVITPQNISAIVTQSGTNYATSSLPSQLVLSGTTPSAEVTQAGTIDTVTTLMLIAQPGNGAYDFFPITLASLPAQGSGTCGGANQPPCAVSVGAGQSITATVTISFQ